MQVTDSAWIRNCCGCGVGQQLQLRFNPSLRTSMCFECGPKDKKKKEGLSPCSLATRMPTRCLLKREHRGCNGVQGRAEQSCNSGLEAGTDCEEVNRRREGPQSERLQRHTRAPEQQRPREPTSHPYSCGHRRARAQCGRSAPGAEDSAGQGSGWVKAVCLRN